MINADSPLTGTYKGVELYKREIKVLKTLEQMIGEPIHHIYEFKEGKDVKETIRFFSSGFATKKKHIIALGLNDMKLTYLPESFGQLTALEGLDLRGNHLTALPESFGQLTALEDLYMPGNQLTYLPESFGQLTALEELDLRDNQLTYLPESFGQLIVLRRLDLSSNHLTTLPESFGQLTALKGLYFSSNQLTVFTKGNWQFFSDLYSFDLKDNPINPAAFNQICWDLLLPGDENLQTFLEAEALSLQFFNEEQLSVLSALSQPDAKLHITAQKTRHKVLLNISDSLIKAFYVGFLGITALLKLSEETLRISIDVTYFLILIILFGVLSISVDRITAHQEREHVELRNKFRDRAVKWLIHPVPDFQRIINDRYLIPQSDMTSARYGAIINLSANTVILGGTALLFIYINPQTGASIEILTFTIILTVGIMIGAFIIFLYYYKKKLPGLRRILKIEFSKTMKDYEEKYWARQKKEKAGEEQLKD